MGCYRIFIAVKKRVRSGTFWNKSQNFIPHTALQVSAFESHLSQTKMPHGTNKYTSSEQRNVECFFCFFLIIGLLCSFIEFIFVYSIFFFLKVNNISKWRFFQIKCIYTTLSVDHKKEKFLNMSHYYRHHWLRKGLKVGMTAV